MGGWEPEPPWGWCGHGPSPRNQRREQLRGRLETALPPEGSRTKSRQPGRPPQVPAAPKRPCPWKAGRAWAAMSWSPLRPGAGPRRGAGAARPGGDGLHLRVPSFPCRESSARTCAAARWRPATPPAAAGCSASGWPPLTAAPPCPASPVGQGLVSGGCTKRHPCGL